MNTTPPSDKNISGAAAYVEDWDVSQTADVQAAAQPDEREQAIAEAVRQACCECCWGIADDVARAIMAINLPSIMRRAARILPAALAAPVEAQPAASDDLRDALQKLVDIQVLGRESSSYKAVLQSAVAALAATQPAAAPADAILLKLCAQLHAMNRTMFNRPGTGQNYSYLVHEDVQAYVEQARAALAARKPAAPSAPSQRDAIAALSRLERANGAICRLRTSEQYLSMIDGGQKDALAELDNARFAARAVLAAPSIPAQAGVPDVPDVPDRFWDIEVTPREPFDDEQPDGMLESDDDFIRRNIEAAVALLEIRIAAAPSAPAAPPAVAGVPDGWKLVPSLPDTEMCNQGMVHPNISHRLARECYIAMLEKSPAYFPASSACPVCGIETPHIHTSEQVVAHRNSLKTSAPSAPADGGEARPVRPLTTCAAGRDGECAHAECPQLRDGEPRASGRHCPLDTADGGEDA